MAHHIFQLETELQNIPEAAPKASRSFSVSEKLARYGSSALSGVEHLRLLIGKDSMADALLRHFGSLKALSRASFKELRQFLPKGKAEAVMAVLSISNIADAEQALSAPLNSAEAIYRANLDMKGFHQEVVRVVLLDTQNRCITKIDISRGTVNEAPEDDLGFNLGSHQASDLFEQEAGCRRIAGPQTIERPDRVLVTLAGARMILGEVDRRRSGLELARHILDIPRVERA
jgi:hypothetical protein